ncbi:hypothetical protein GCM10007426_20690 [Alloalcanivorax dieselolei]|nr:hypothetical protein GCM10007426_20690 [Alloalcanivorax dieselolei]
MTGTGFRLETGFALPFNHSFHHLLLLGTGAARRARPQMGAQITTERPRDHTLRAWFAASGAPRQRTGVTPLRSRGLPPLAAM